MITRAHMDDATRSEALYSPCERYRYGLSRIWDDAGGLVLFVMLNPSTATELRNDPTIERCERRTRAMGFGGFRIANLFGLRATRPAELKAAEDPVGVGNDEILYLWGQGAEMTIAAWGVHGAYLGQGRRMARELPQLWHLGLTKHGHPRHPLYVPYATGPEFWPQEKRYPDD
ncbi:hypothetical protein P775_10215 [Puniceibacterium antarcticum]|uniref:DUF1643 domain-containing protein n=2 Tax=Puniceibacterium antarcticum TaxID=1206336 RepID=A0A2G8RFF1_9RHOB|nr:hypothetical protein P775_10215 [Puniceibacterium antarcticum]